MVMQSGYRRPARLNPICHYLRKTFVEMNGYLQDLLRNRRQVFEMQTSRDGEILAGSLDRMVINPTNTHSSLE